MTSEQRILQVLAAADRELYGLDIVAAGQLRLVALYVTLSHLEDRGLIESRFEEAPEPRRRLYRITDAGRAKLLPVLPVATALPPKTP